MNSDDEIRDLLASRLARLLARTERIESDLRKPGNPDWPERASERANDEVLERLGSRERAEVAEIRAALARLEVGRYGLCQGCGSRISPKRLSALPEAPSCAACARTQGVEG